MCGLFGVLPGNQEIVRDLMLLSDSRGKEASGLITLSESGVQIYKQPVRVSALIKQEHANKLLQQNNQAIIGHARLATNGQFNDNKNNQPVQFGSFVGVHNGIITNTKALWRKLKLKPKLEVDSEVIFALFEHYSPLIGLEATVDKIFRLIEGAASIAVVSTRESKIILASNTGSLFYSKNSDITIFASERYILEQVRKKHKLNFKIIQLKAGGNIIVDLPKPINTKRIIDLSNHRRAPKSKNINTLKSLKQHSFDYDRIYAIKRCTKCLLPISTPYISYDAHGICSYCLNHKPFKAHGKKAFESLIEPFRSENGSPDCLIGFSGGRDSSYGLHLLVKEYGLNPIAYTYDWGMLSDLGRENAARLTGKLGVEHVIVSADIQRKRNNIRKNILAWLKKPDLGMIPLFTAGDKQSEYYMNELSNKTGIKLIIYCRGNQFEIEEFKAGHSGVKNADPGGVIHDLSWKGKLQLLTYYGKQFISNPSYLNSSMIDTAGAYACTYLIPHNYTYLWHYLDWNESTIIKTLQQEYNWQKSYDSIATWRIDDGTPAFYNYIYYQVQGFTEHDSLRSHQIREGILSREEAWNLVKEENKPRYESLLWYFETLNLDGNKVLSVVDAMPKLY